MATFLKKSILFLSFCLFVFIQNGRCQENFTQTVRGTILDHQSEMPLTGAIIELLNVEPKIGAVADFDGFFVLKNVPIGRQVFHVRYLGYEEMTVPNVLVTAGKEIQLNLRLEESLSALKEVVISAGANKDHPINELATISARQFNTEEVQRYSGGRNDVAKLVSNFAGVSASNDSRNDIIIRGNSPTGVLWRLEGVPMPNPNHFSTVGTTGGPVSALNPNLIANSDFLTGAFPAEYGNAQAGVFDINLRKGNIDRFEMTGQIAAFSGFEGIIEGPLNRKNNGSFVVAYRHSFVEMAANAGLDVGTKALPRYKDLTFNVDFGHKEDVNFSLFGILATSDINFIGAELDSTDFFVDATTNAYNKTSFAVLGLKHNFLINNSTYIRTIFSGSYTDIAYEQDDVSNPEISNYREVEAIDKLPSYRISSFINSKINSRFSLRSGLLLQIQRYETLFKTRENTLDLDGDGFRDWWVQRDYNGSFNNSEAYMQTKYRVSEKLTVLAGVHALYFDRTSDFAIEPRFAVNYTASPKHSFNLGYGLHNQSQPLPVFLFQEIQADGSYKATNNHLLFSRNTHFVAGYDFKPSSDWRIKIETYYQKLDRVPVDTFASAFSMLNSGADFLFPEKGSLTNTGTGKNTGVELTIEKFFSKNYYTLLSLSLFDSKYTPSDGFERSSAFDGGFVLNTLAGKEFPIGKKKQHALTLDTKFTWAGGRPYTPIDLNASRQLTLQVLDESRAFKARHADYLRWDVKFGYRMNSTKRKLSQTFYLDFQNVTNRENIFAQRYNPSTEQIGTIYQIGFFPDLLYRIEF